jgi:hypothetical protein
MAHASPALSHPNQVEEDRCHGLRFAISERLISDTLALNAVKVDADLCHKCGQAMWTQRSLVSRGRFLDYVKGTYRGDVMA